MISPTLKEFIYIDRDSIERMYAQTVERLEISQSETQSRVLAGSFGLSGKLKSLFLGFLGQVEMSGKAEASGSKGRSITTIREMSINTKLWTLIEALKDSTYGTCYSNLSEAARYSLESRQKVFFCGEHQFEAPQFYTENGPQMVTETGYLLLRDGPDTRYDDADDYYKRHLIGVEMACSILKMPRSEKGMPRSGHDAIMFRGCRGTRIPLHVFSSVIPLSGFVQLKPYAIWI